MTKMWGVRDPTGMILLANISKDVAKEDFRDQMCGFTGVRKAWRWFAKAGYKLVQVEVKETADE